MKDWASPFLSLLTILLPLSGAMWVVEYRDLRRCRQRPDMPETTTRIEKQVVFLRGITIAMLLLFILAMPFASLDSVKAALYLVALLAFSVALLLALIWMDAHRA